MIGVFDFPSSLKHEIERYITYVKPYQLHSSLHNVKPLITIISSYYILRTVRIFTSCKKYKKKLYFQHYNLTRLYANTFPLSLQRCRNYSIRLRYFFAFINICFHLWLTVSFSQIPSQQYVFMAWVLLKTVSFAPSLSFSTFFSLTPYL